MHIEIDLQSLLRRKVRIMNGGNSINKIKKKLSNKKSIVTLVTFAVIILVIILYFVFRKIPVESISVTSKSIEVNVDDVITPDIEFYPNNSSNKNVIYKTADENIIKIDDRGYPVAVDNGETMLTVISSENESVTDEVKVIVNTKISSINAKPLDKYIQIGDEKQLEYEIFPEKTVNKNVTWKSSDDNILTVDEKGVVTAVNNGNVTVTIQSEERPEVKGTIDILVETQVTDVFILNDESVINIGNQLQLSIGCLPDNAAPTEFKFESSDSSVLSVSESGLVTGVSQGEADITLTSKNGTSTIKHLYVAKKPESITITNSSIVGYINDTGEIGYSLQPTDSYASKVSYSSNSDCIEVTDSGKYIMKSAGTATITVSVEGGPSSQITATCKGPKSSYMGGNGSNDSVLRLEKYRYNGNELANIPGVKKKGTTYYNNSFEAEVRNGRIVKANVFGAGASMFGVTPGNSAIFMDMTMLVSGGASFRCVNKQLQYYDYESSSTGEMMRIYFGYTISEIVYVGR